MDICHHIYGQPCFRAVLVGKNYEKCKFLFHSFVAKGNMKLLKQHFSTRAMNVGNLTNKLCTDQKRCWMAGRFLM